MKIEKIICAVDASNSSKQALAFANKLATKFSAQLSVVHIFPAELRMKNEFKEHVIEEINTWLNGLLKSPIIHLDGIISEELQKLSKSNDLLVMGLRGSNHSSRYYGSNAAQVIQTASCPVFLIPDAETDFHFKKIVFASDFKDIVRDENLEALRDLADHQKAELHLLHVSGNTVLDTEEGDEAIELHAIFKDINHAFFVVEEQDIVKGIQKHIKDNKIDLLAIMPRKTTKLAHTLSQAIINETESIPIFSFHA
ncbi:universal stress protein [Fulvivirga lutea]|uniref:Universal stress protein n=1 Tax=Fulvivirga lutea TaxID=2810512 RepID=A0A974WI88_9BACT|nr:universal stress protein [Fulvivirga lutea]QSE96620.1 universal stress protein [Fulvivirga lutea]